MLIRIKKFKIQIIILACVIFLILGIVLFQNQIELKNDAIVYITFAINGGIWIVLLIKALLKHPFSLKIMHWFFCLFFFFFAAIIQYINDKYPWGVKFQCETIIKSNICLLLWTVAFVIGEFISRKSDGFGGRTQKTIENIRKKRIILTSISAITVVIKLVVVGFSNMLARSTIFSVKYVNDPSLNMMINGCFQATTFFALALSIIEIKKVHSVENIVYAMINSCLMLFGYFPSGLARYALAVLYLGILLTCFDFMKNKRNFILLFIFAFIIILPVMNTWRFVSFKEASVGESLKGIITNFSGVWLENDYDAFTELSMSIEHIEKYGAGGFHLLSIALFWIPRSLWSTKAFPGSHDVTLARSDVSFDNVSCSLPEEGILDGGFLGVLVFGVFIGWLVGIIDKTYYSKKLLFIGERKINYYDLIYPVTVIFFFFLIRGDMLYTFPYLVSYLLVWGWISFDLKKDLKIVKK